jgi:pimeloyl-ACP methyl ester carboxylesterase
MRRLPDARRVSVDGAGHMVPITHPAEVAEAIRDFLNDVPLA